MSGHWRFHRSFKLLPGLRLNLNKRSVSVTAGGRRGGPHVTASTTGNVTTSAGLPGTGLSYRHTTRVRRAARHVRRRLYWYVVVVLVVAYTVWSSL
jgi:hypothetical protein